MTETRRNITISVLALCLASAACGSAPTADAPAATEAEPADVATEAGSAAAHDGAQTPEPDSTQASATSLDCQDGFPAVYAELDGLEGDERTDRLVELAQEEGELMVYTSNNEMPDVAPAFAEEFDIATEVYRAPSDAVSQRVHEEADAGQIRSDIIDNIAQWQVVALRSGLLTEYEGPVREDLPEIALGEGFTSNQYLPHTIGWNTDLVSEEERPRSYADLTEPRWEGKFTLEPRHSAMYMALYNYFIEEGSSEAEVHELFRKIGSNAVLMDGNTQRINLMTTGEYSAGVGMYSQGIDKAAREGAPVAWEPAVEPIYVETYGAGLSTCATHPAAALLFYEWVATDGQEEMAALGRVTTEDFAAGGRFDGLELLQIDYGTFVDEQQRWDEEWYDLIGYQ